MLFLMTFFPQMLVDYDGTIEELKRKNGRGNEGGGEEMG